MSIEIAGTYPMLFSFFDEEDCLRRDAFTRQVSAAIASKASGIAVLGLGTEVGKLAHAERRQIVDWVMADVAEKLPVAVTISDGNIPDMIASARAARAAGAAWLVLQPPRPPIAGPQLVQFFGRIAEAVDCPVAIQNAPEFLGVGLTVQEVLELNRQHPNVSIVKAESTALAVGEFVDRLEGRMKVFNGRAGLELTDNYRAGVDGMIPGMDTVDLQVGVEQAMRAGNEDDAEARYRVLLPAISFCMQGLSRFLLYGKLIAAIRLGIKPSADRLPCDIASARGTAWARRYADQFGPLPCFSRR